MKKYIHKKEGFTLIEMMVVIAVVGILSAAVLAGLAPSRNKAKDARIMSGVQQARAIAETHYDPFAGGYPDEAPTDAGYAKIVDDLNKLRGDTAGLTYTASGNNFAISASLASGGSYCVDSAGNVTADQAQSGGTCGEGSAPRCGDGICNGGETTATCLNDCPAGTPVGIASGGVCAVGVVSNNAAENCQASLTCTAPAGNSGATFGTCR